MITIWKFIIDSEDMETEMPQDAQLLHVHEQNGELCVWAIVNTTNTMMRRQFDVYGTGHPMVVNSASRHPTSTHPYVGTVHLMGGALVFHVFDKGESPL